MTAVAVLGIALIAMGEDIGTDMSFRTFGHLVSRTIIIAELLSYYCAAQLRIACCKVTFAVPHGVHNMNLIVEVR